MKIIEIFEARKNPKINVSNKQMFVDILKDVRNRYPSDDLYLRMTNIPKLGVNPQTEYSTPLGLSSYSLDYAISLLESGRRLPYRDNQPYGIVFKSEDVNLLNVSSRNVISDVSIDDIVEAAANSTHISTREIREIGNVVSRVIKDLTTGQNVYVFVSHLADHIVTKFKLDADLSRGSGDDEFNKVKGLLKTKILRRLGYDGVQDPGTGVIFPHEPNQTIVFSGKGLKVVKLINRIEEDSTYSVSKGAIQLKEPYKGKHLSKEVTKKLDQYQRRLDTNISPALSSKTLDQVIGDNPTLIKKLRKPTISQYMKYIEWFYNNHPSEKLDINIPVDILSKIIKDKPYVADMIK